MSLSHNLVVLGNSGLLGSAVVRCVQKNAGSRASRFDLVQVDTRALLAEVEAGDHSKIDQILSIPGAGQSWLYCAGDVNPHSEASKLKRLNCTLPYKLYRVLEERSARRSNPVSGPVRFVTFGSVMEERARKVRTNSYISSKADLYEHFNQPAHRPHVAWTHFRLHTLYGGKAPHDHMFLGQMAQALKNRETFAMSGGQQVREYHHADDIAATVLDKLSTPQGARSLITLGNDQPLTLLEIATAVFRRFNRQGQLSIGVQETPAGEQFVTERERVLKTVTHERDAIAGIIDWFESLGVVQPDDSLLQ